MNGRIKSGFVAAVVSASLMTAGVPGVAFAAKSNSLQSSIADARATYEELAMASAEVGEALNDTYYALDQTRSSIKNVTGEIDAKKVELEAAKKVLSDRIAASYRAGNRSVLDMMMGSSTVEDLVGAIYYADKAVEGDTAAIDAVKTTKAELETKKAELTKLEKEQTELATQQEAQAAALKEAQAEVSEYIDGLEPQVYKQIEDDRAAEIAAQKSAAAKAITVSEDAKPQVEAPLKWEEEKAEQKSEATEAAKPATSEATPTEATPATPEATPAEAAPAEETPAQTTPAETAPAENAAENTNENGASESAPAETAPAEHTPANTEEAPAPAKEEAIADEVANTVQEIANSTDQEVTPELVEQITEQVVSETSDSEATSSDTDSVRSAILAAAYSQLGVPYVYGAESPGEALDCSGFTQYCYSQAGIDIPHSSVGQAGMADKTSIDELQAGDLVFWEGTASGSASGSHVAIYLGDGQIIHANGTEVAIGTLSDSYTSCGSIS